jgi:23S rRNA (cytosine1962-C5)-methyltransferase
MVKVFLRPGKEEPVRRFHPWVFSGAIARVDGQPADGDIAGVYDRGGNLLGLGHFHHGSIAVRMLSFGDADLEQSRFWEDRLAAALRVRETALRPLDQQTGFRLVHGEGDGLSGLVVDVYNGTAVLQCHSIGMHRQRETIAAACVPSLARNSKRCTTKAGKPFHRIMRPGKATATCGRRDRKCRVRQLFRKTGFVSK